MFIFRAWESIKSTFCVFCLSSDDPGPWDPRDPVAVDPSLCPSTIQDLAESGPLELEVAFASIWHTRAVRELGCWRSVSNAVNNAILATRASTVCSTLVSLEVDNLHGFTDGLHVVVKICESTREWQQKYLGAPWTVHRLSGGPIPSRSGPETIRRAIIRRGTKHRWDRHIGPIMNTCHENRWETTTLGCRHLDKTKPEKLVNGEKPPHTVEQEMAWAKMATDNAFKMFVVLEICLNRNLWSVSGI